MAHRDEGGFSGRGIADLPTETTASHTHFVLPRLAFRRGRIAANRPVRDYNGQALAYIYCEEELSASLSNKTG
jgi:hypothetical protein